LIPAEESKAKSSGSPASSSQQQILSYNFKGGSLQFLQGATDNLNRSILRPINVKSSSQFNSDENKEQEAFNDDTDIYNPYRSTRAQGLSQHSPLKGALTRRWPEEGSAGDAGSAAVANNDSDRTSDHPQLLLRRLQESSVDS